MWEVNGKKIQEETQRQLTSATITQACNDALIWILIVAVVVDEGIIIENKLMFFTKNTTTCMLAFLLVLVLVLVLLVNSKANKLKLSLSLRSWSHVIQSSARHGQRALHRPSFASWSICLKLIRAPHQLRNYSQALELAFVSCVCFNTEVTSIFFFFYDFFF